MNIVVLSGNLSKDPKVSKSNNGTTILNCTIAVNREYKDKDGSYKTDFIDFTCFGATAEFLNKIAHKGSFVIIEGSWQVRNYTNKDKQEVYVNEVICKNVQVPPTPKAESDEKPKAKKSVTPQEAYDELEVTSDDLPF
jgi:single-strand DNA-binding protein